MYNDFAGRWLGRDVTFRLLGHTVTGLVVEVDDWNRRLTAEFLDGPRRVRVSGAFQAFRRGEQVYLVSAPKPGAREVHGED